MVRAARRVRRETRRGGFGIEGEVGNREWGMGNGEWGGI
jgi:hypothetical protein